LDSLDELTAVIDKALDRVVRDVSNGFRYAIKTLFS